MIRRLSESIGVTGYEFEISKDIQELLENCNFEKNIDNIGNITYYKKGIEKNKKKILIVSHMDEVGMQINNIVNNKKLKFKVLGNIHSYNLYQQRVKFSNGVKGVISADNPLKLEKYNYDNLYITLLNESELEIGDVCTFDSIFIENQDFIMGKALDNRIGCYIIIKTMEKIKECKDDLYISFTTQEELGFKGIKVALNLIKPDEVIVIDTVPEDKDASIVCGGGAAIKISDGSSVCSHDVVCKLKNISRQNNIKYQLEATEYGGTEVSLIIESNYGIKCGAISIPIINMHTANSIVNKNDVLNSINLLTEYIFT